MVYSLDTKLAEDSHVTSLRHLTRISDKVRLVENRIMWVAVARPVDNLSFISLRLNHSINNNYSWSHEVSCEVLNMSWQ